MNGKSDFVMENGKIKLTESDLFSKKYLPLTVDAANSKEFNDDYQAYKGIFNSHCKMRQNKMTGDGAYKDTIDKFSDKEPSGFRKLINKSLKKE